MQTGPASGMPFVRVRRGKTASVYSSTGRNIRISLKILAHLREDLIISLFYNQANGTCSYEGPAFNTGNIASMVPAEFKDKSIIYTRKSQETILSKIEKEEKRLLRPDEKRFIAAIIKMFPKQCNRQVSDRTLPEDLEDAIDKLNSIL